jgi:hypothetical protein
MRVALGVDTCFGSSRTLKDLQWQQGDYICVSIYTPSMGSGVNPVPPQAVAAQTGPATRNFGWNGRSATGPSEAPIARGPPGARLHRESFDSPAEGSWTKAREETAALPDQGLPPPFSIRGRGSSSRGGGMSIRGGRELGGRGRGRSRSPDYTKRHRSRSRS